MSTSSKVVQGVFGEHAQLIKRLADADGRNIAINKPTGPSSAQVLRDLQKHFDPSDLFKPWYAAERAKRQAEPDSKFRRKRDKRKLSVKMGHGGTLDPLAAGVLVVGVGSGTKEMDSFLHCTKEYETVLLFGAASDTYDVKGKIVGKAPYEHITRAKVETAMEKFRGKMMQKPPVYSAIRVNGKRMYEYAREGGEIPEIKTREIEVKELEMVEWLEAGTHGYKWPVEEASEEEKEVAEKLLAHTRELMKTAKSPRPRSERSKATKTITSKKTHRSVGGALRRTGKKARSFSCPAR